MMGEIVYENGSGHSLCGIHGTDILAALRAKWVD